MALSEVDESEQEGAIIFILVADNFEEHVLWLEVIVHNLVVSEETQSNGYFVHEVYLSFQRDDFLMAVQIGVDGFLRAVLQKDLVWVIPAVVVASDEQGFAAGDGLEYVCLVDAAGLLGGLGDDQVGRGPVVLAFLTRDVQQFELTETAFDEVCFLCDVVDFQLGVD
jgi:hypothetical protein